ncbi:hypothetical protein DFH28DRAFT_209716 [Melampsora americana]|nr:hypothetical protein DFH28DRAFT_209716 [Melampsora americana]
MNSSPVSDHIRVWRDMVYSYRNARDSAEEHELFIQHCTEDLDSSGFQWTRGNITQMMILAGPSPELPAWSNFESYKECRLTQPITPLTSNKRDHIVQSKGCCAKRRQVGLSILPTDLLIEIVQRVYEISQIESRKPRTPRLTNVEGARTQKYVETDAFNSIQALAAVNKDFYQFCLPWLWKTVRCPRVFKRTKDFWTNFILFKHATHITSLTLHLSRESLEIPDESDMGPSELQGSECMKSPKFCANRRIKQKCSSDEETEGISRDIIVKSIRECINLRELVIISPSMFHTPRKYDEEKYSSGLRQLLEYLTIPIFELKYLRHLELNNDWGPDLCEKQVTDILDKLMSLESFTGVRIKSYSPLGKSQSLGWRLSQLKQLSQLRLIKVDCIDISWSLHHWQNSLTLLEISSCSGVTLTVAHKLIQLFSSSLTALTLSFGFVHYDIVHDATADIFWPSQYCYTLPCLTELKLESVYPGFLSTFRDCGKLRYLNLEIAEREDWLTLQMLVCETTWPRLNSIEMGKTRVNYPTSKVFDRLQDACNIAGIRLG